MRNGKVLIALAAALLMALLSASALASVPSAPKEFYFLDQADVLSEATEGEIFFSNKLLEEACGAQIVVVTVDSTKPQAIDDYCYDLFNKWGIGDGNKNNGFLLLLAIGDEDYYAVPGSSLQPKFTSSSLKQYFDDYLETDFAAGRYDAGVKKFFEAAFKRVADTYNANVTTAQGIAAYRDWLGEGSTVPMTARSGGALYSNRYDGGGEGGNGMLGIIVFVLILILVLSLMGRSRYRRGYGGGFPLFFFFGGPNRRTPPPPRAPYGGMGPGPGPGGFRGAPPRQSGGSGFMSSLFRDMMRSGGAGRSSGGGFRSSGGSSRSSSFGSSRGGGGSTRGGGAGRGRH